MNDHEILMASPPWEKFKKHQKHLDSAKPPPGEALAASGMFAMFELGLAQLPTKDHCVFVWVDQSLITDCQAYMTGKGYTLYRSYVWMQVKEKGPDITFPCTHLEWYHKGELLPPAPSVKQSGRALIGSVRSRYSKPDTAYQMIEALYPHHAKAELFGWERRPGWEQWANYKDRLK